MTEISALKGLAEKATPGPWTHSNMGVAPASDPENGTIALGLAWPTREFSEREANIAYIAAASPDVMLRLVAIAEAAQKVSDRNVRLAAICRTELSREDAELRAALEPFQQEGGK